MRSLEDAREYYEGLAGRWPERAQVLAHLCDQAAHVPAGGTVVELCAGGGQLAYPLLSRFPELRYVGFDLLPHGIEYAREKLAPFGARVTLHQADLNGEAWLQQVPDQVDAWLSLQSLHDLGDASAVSRIYKVTRRFLPRGGRWLLADLLRQSSADPDTDPGRLSVDEHLQLFADAGYAHAQCTMQTADFGCFVAEN